MEPVQSHNKGLSNANWINSWYPEVHIQMEFTAPTTLNMGFKPRQVVSECLP